MEDRALRQVFTRLDWRWLIVTYCFLILFHLVPSFLLRSWSVGFSDARFLVSRGSVLIVLLAILWVVGGIGSVCAFTAFRSRGFTIFEPGLAAAAYAYTFLLGIKSISQTSWHFSSATYIAAMLVAAFVVGFAGAAVGEWLQMRKYPNKSLTLT